MWWLRRSISTTSASACRSACAAAIPAKPPPMITTRLRSRRGTSTMAVAPSGRLSANIALMDHLVCALCRDGYQQLPFIVLSMSQPLGFARASRREHRSERAGSPRQDHLVGHPLIGAQRRLGGEQIESDVCMLIGRSGGRLGISFVENAERIELQQGSSQRNSDLIAAALDRTPSQRRENADCAEPTHHIVAKGDDCRRLGMRGRPLDTEQPRHGSADLIESGTILPRAFVTV